VIFFSLPPLSASRSSAIFPFATQTQDVRPRLVSSISLLSAPHLTHHWLLLPFRFFLLCPPRMCVAAVFCRQVKQFWTFSKTFINDLIDATIKTLWLRLEATEASRGNVRRRRKVFLGSWQNLFQWLSCAGLVFGVVPAEHVFSGRSKMSRTNVRQLSDRRH
jgi:hypothetical protein